MEFFEDMSSPEKLICIRAAEQKIPINGIIELTPLCNMDCDMCYVRLSREEMEKKGRLRTAAEWLEMGRQMQSEGVIFLLLTGGEPLTYPDFKEVYLGLKEMGMIITINTNGTLIDESWAEFFAENKPRRINITLYGANEETYKNLCHYSDGFSKTLRSISLLKKYGVDVKINGSLTRSNLGDRDKLIDLAKSLDVTCKIDTYMYPCTRERNKPFNQQSRLTAEEAAYNRVMIMKQYLGENNFKKKAQNMIATVMNTKNTDAFLQNISCRAGSSSFVINWQGEMRPCIMLTSPSVPVFEMNFNKAWNKLVNETTKIMLSPKCASCFLREVCQTCAACALLESGSYSGIPEYMCCYTKSTYNIIKKELEIID